MHTNTNVNTTAISNLSQFNSLVSIKKGEGKLIQAMGPDSFQVISPSFRARILLTFFGYKSADTRYEIVNQTVKNFYTQNIQPNLKDFSIEQLTSLLATLRFLEGKWRKMNPICGPESDITVYKKLVQIHLDNKRNPLPQTAIESDMSAPTSTASSSASAAPAASSPQTSQALPLPSLKLGEYISERIFQKITKSGEAIKAGDFAIVKRSGQRNGEAGYQYVEIQGICENGDITFIDGSGNSLSKKPLYVHALLPALNPSKAKTKRTNASISAAPKVATMPSKNSTSSNAEISSETQSTSKKARKNVTFSNLTLGKFVLEQEALKMTDPTQKINAKDFAFVRRTGKEGYQCVQIVKVTDDNTLTFIDGSNQLIEKDLNCFIPLNPKFFPLNDNKSEDLSQQALHTATTSTNVSTTPTSFSLSSFETGKFISKELAMQITKPGTTLKEGDYAIAERSGNPEPKYQCVKIVEIESDGRICFDAGPEGFIQKPAKFLMALAPSLGATKTEAKQNNSSSASAKKSAKTPSLSKQKQPAAPVKAPTPPAAPIINSLFKVGKIFTKEEYTKIADHSGQIHVGDYVIAKRKGGILQLVKVVSIFNNTVKFNDGSVAGKKGYLNNHKETFTAIKQMGLQKVY